MRYTLKLFERYLKRSGRYIEIQSDTIHQIYSDLIAVGKYLKEMDLKEEQSAMLCEKLTTLVNTINQAGDNLSNLNKDLNDTIDLI